MSTFANGHHDSEGDRIVGARTLHTHILPDILLVATELHSHGTRGVLAYVVMVAVEHGTNGAFVSVNIICIGHFGVNSIIICLLETCTDLYRVLHSTCT